MAKSNISTCRPPIPSRFPWLVYCHGKRSNTQTFYNIEGGNYDIKKIPDMSNKYVCANSHGWTVMVDVDLRSDICFLLNLVSMEKIKLPPWKYNEIPRFCILTLPPSDPKSTVALFDPERPCIMFCHPGEKVWREWQFDNANYDLRWQVISCEGKIYCFIPSSNKSMEVKVLDVHGPEMRQLRVEKIERPTWDVPSARFSKWHLIESLGEIFLVIIILSSHIKFKIRDIYVYKMDFKKVEWKRVNNLGVHRIFFISDETSMSCSSIGPSGRVKENSIYIVAPPFKEIENTSTYIYDMEEKTITTCIFCPNVVYNVTGVQWIM